MKRLLVATLCLLATACTLTPSTPPTSAPKSADESPAVREALAAYTTAAVAKDGATAVTVVASTFLKVYDDVRKLALTATEQELADVPVSRRVIAYAMRGDLDAATLRSASPKDLVTAAFNKGLVNAQNTGGIELGAVAVDGDVASAEVLVKGEKAPYKFRFLREDGRWKLDLEPVLALTDTALAAVAKQKNVTVEQLVEQALVTKYGAAKAAEVRKPIGA
ncbi:hypothetical protein ACIA8G_12405 [Lentzea sp. NPDC051213]|uniref:hypothetical protein n=1 Tax=Lentzea sp. NPDC051213 TaxID=3364126 RepID=UPI00378B24C5